MRIDPAGYPVWSEDTDIEHDLTECCGVPFTERCRSGCEDARKTCPDCRGALTVSANQDRCQFADDPGHGAQTWWDCPNGHSWEDEEL